MNKIKVKSTFNTLRAASSSPGNQRHKISLQNDSRPFFALHHSLFNAQTSVLVTKKTAVITACICLILASLANASARDFFVAISGSNANGGTLAAPFRTIQKCADVAQAGDTCYVRAGIYRETVRPANSGADGAPITFKSYNNEKVVISGADPITGWTLHRGSIYRAAAAWDLGAGNNQIFVNGLMLTEARYPNTGLDPSNPRVARVMQPAGSGLTWSIAAPNLPHVSLAGAKVNVLPGTAWIAETADVTEAGAGRFTFTSTNGQIGNNPPWAPTLYDPAEGNPYFIWGKLGLLDAPGEWFHDGANLYLWLPNGGNPNGTRVEVKRRPYAFDLTARSHVTIQGFNVFAATITTNNRPEVWFDPDTHHVVIDGINARYISHFTEIRANALGSLWNFGVNSTGIILFGRNHELRNSTITYSAGNGVVLHGHDHKVVNNIVREVDYAATDTAAVQAGCPFCGDATTSSNHEIGYNTLFNGARSIITHRLARNARIHHNDIFYAGLQGSDLGMTYTYESDGAGTEIAYNLVHDNLARHTALGIYLDNGSRNYIVHHNLSWNSDEGLRLNLPSLNNKIYHNTLLGKYESVNSWGFDISMLGTELYNNIFTKSIHLVSGATEANNLKQEVDPKFADAAANNFQLQATSPAVNAGRLLPGYNDDYAGTAPDLGAFERGRPAWKAGADSGLPRPWVRDDIGGVGVAGNSTYQNGSFTITASGADIWNAVDGFHYVYRPLAGDGTITARVANVEAINPWSKAGVMIRESLGADVRQAMVVLTPANGAAFQRRPVAGGPSYSTAQANATAPQWVKLVRKGDEFTSYKSADGVTWEFIGSEIISMRQQVFVGLAVTSHNNAALAQAMFDNVQLIEGGTGLLGEYFVNPNLTGTRIVRHDPQINFEWGASAPVSPLGADHFSVRWTGRVQAKYSEIYNFSTWSDDGVRLWINGEKIIDNWTVHGPTTDTSAGIRLEAGKFYDIKLEYFEYNFGANISLFWESASQPRQIIPQNYLSSPPIATSRIEAESYNQMQGIINSGNAIGGLDNGDWVRYGNIDFGNGVSTFTANIGVPAENAGRQIEVRLDDVTGPLIGTLTVQATGDWSTFTAQTIPVTGASGVRDTVLVMRGGYGAGNLDSFTFNR